MTIYSEGNPPAAPALCGTGASAHLVAEAAALAMAACTEFARAGVQVLWAHVRPGAPMVAVAMPPAGMRGALHKRTRYEEVLIGQLYSGVLVRWCVARRAR